LTNTFGPPARGGASGRDQGRARERRVCGAHERRADEREPVAVLGYAAYLIDGAYAAFGNGR
jgi:hypothetical protein